MYFERRHGGGKKEHIARGQLRHDMKIMVGLILATSE
jgi:hypothetical protein